jgi:hypothetical protein
MYQDRLMETFLPDQEAVEKQVWGLAKQANTARLSDMCSKETPGPLHLFCATVNLQNSTDPCVRGRGGDSFVMSPLYCGSFATGYQKTTEFMKGKLHLASAMSISAAAANPNAAPSGRGILRSPILGFMMTLLNIRLGVWVPNPNHKRASKRGSTPNFFFPGLQDLLGVGYKESSAFLELADGVNFENLAMYEQIRRRVKILIVSHGGAGFGDLANACEKVRVDYGVGINFEDPEYDLRWMLPGSGDTGPASKEFGLCKRGFAVGTIRYPDGLIGKLLYIKTTLTEGLPSDVYGYKSGHPSYPEQSTADQFFNEEQFEAYRELGYQIGTDLFEKLDENWNFRTSASSLRAV